MSTTIQLTPHSEELLKEQLARGPYRSPEEVIETALETLAERRSGALTASFSKKTPAEAVGDILELRKGVRLGGLNAHEHLCVAADPLRLAIRCQVRIRCQC